MKKTFAIGLALFAGVFSAAEAQVYVPHSVTQAPLLVASAGTDQTSCGDSVQLGGSPTAGGGTSPYAYGWSPSAGLNNTTAANPTAAPSASATYIVLVTDINNCTSYDTVNVTAGSVTAGFTSNANLLVVNFTDLSAGASTWSWDFGDGNSSTAQNPSHTYPVSGTYIACLTVDQGTACEDSSCQILTLNGVGVTPGLNVSVKVYPNPSAGSDVNFVVEGMQLTEEVNIDLMDLQGRLVRQYNGAPAKAVHTLARKGLANGVYQYSVRSGESVLATGKLVLE